MANSVNTVAISGNVGRCEHRTTKDGLGILSFSVAVNEYKGGEDYTSWVNCVMFGKRADSLEQYLQKGVRVCVQGKLRETRWEKDDQKRSRLEVIVAEVNFMSAARQDAPVSPEQAAQYAQQAIDAVHSAYPDAEVTPYQDEDIPF